MKHIASLALLSLSFVACGDDDGSTVYFDADDISTPQTFWNFPFPSDERLDGNGAPDVAAFPNPRNVPIRGS